MQYLIEYGPIGAFAIFILLDKLMPARALPTVRRWRGKGLLFFVLYVVIATALPMTVNAWFGEHRLIDATGLGLAAGTFVGVMAYELVAYWWHRALHRVPVLWRWLHQMHHSAERIDVFGAFYFHPLDMVGWTLVSSVALVLGVGVSAEAAGLANVIIGAIAILGHANLKTPRWLGYIVQRPENHAAHHERGVHAYNYADISLFDMMFGTFKNPESFPSEAGFYDGASQELGDMLLGRDISSAPAGSPALPAAPSADIVTLDRSPDSRMIA